MSLNHFQSVFGLNDTALESIRKTDEKCGYSKFVEDALQFPPKGRIESLPKRLDCTLWEEIVEAATYVNPCFNVYHLTEYCPFLWNILGFPSKGDGPSNYFNRDDVKKALHTPPVDYSVCSDYEFFAPSGDTSPPSSFEIIPSVIERTNKTIIAHGDLDFLLFTNGSLVSIQNMTWNGAQGFQQRPSDKFFVPYHPGLKEIVDGSAQTPFIQDAGAGYLGETHTERGLTWVTVTLAGHGKSNYNWQLTEKEEHQ